MNCSTENTWKKKSSLKSCLEDIVQVTSLSHLGSAPQCRHEFLLVPLGKISGKQSIEPVLNQFHELVETNWLQCVAINQMVIPSWVGCQTCFILLSALQALSPVSQLCFQFFCWHISSTSLVLQHGPWYSQHWWLETLIYYHLPLQCLSVFSPPCLMFSTVASPLSPFHYWWL